VFNPGSAIASLDPRADKLHSENDGNGAGGREDPGRGPKLKVNYIFRGAELYSDFRNSFPMLSSEQQNRCDVSSSAKFLRPVLYTHRLLIARGHTILPWLPEVILPLVYMDQRCCQRISFGRVITRISSS
jgi:hypothetical protein